MNIVIVGKRSRELDNLHAMLESITFIQSIESISQISDAIKYVDTHPYSVVFVDYRDPNSNMDNEIAKLILDHDCGHLVLLETWNGPHKQFTHYSTSGLVLNDLSVGVLRNFLNNVYECRLA